VNGIRKKRGTALSGCEWGSKIFRELARLQGQLKEDRRGRMGNGASWTGRDIVLNAQYGEDSETCDPLWGNGAVNSITRGQTTGGSIQFDWSGGREMKTWRT